MKIIINKSNSIISSKTILKKSLISSPNTSCISENNIKVKKKKLFLFYFKMEKFLKFTTRNLKKEFLLKNKTKFLIFKLKKKQLVRRDNSINNLVQGRLEIRNKFVKIY